MFGNWVDFSDLASAATQHGFSIAGVLDRSEAQDVLNQDVKRLEQWQAQGFGAQMGYMNRPAKLFGDLPNFLPQVRSVVSFLVPYQVQYPRNTPMYPTREGFGRIARYAWGEDYHKVLGRKLKDFVRSIGEQLQCKGRDERSEGILYRVFSDAVPLLERAMGAGAGLGFIGKNTMLIRPKLGSFTFICEILWNLEVKGLPKKPRILEVAKCGSCSRCLQQCPTGAFKGPYQLDSRLCISYLTIEKRGVLEEGEARSIGEWLFGCDICQEVCPFNSSGKLENNPQNNFTTEFASDRGPGPFLALEDLLQCSAASFKERFFNTALMRTGREGMLRNAICVAANTKYRPAIPYLQSLLEDCSAVLRRQASWGLAELS